MRFVYPIALLAAVVLGCTPKGETGRRPATEPVANTEVSPAATPETTAPESGVTLAGFQKIKTGMTYKQVVEVLGKEGELLSESDIAGIKTEMYQWKAGFPANMNATFQRGKLVSKAQFGLE